MKELALFVSIIAVMYIAYHVVRLIRFNLKADVSIDSLVEEAINDIRNTIAIENKVLKEDVMGLYDAYRQSMMIVTKMIEHYNIPPEDVNKMQLNIIENMVFIKTYADYLGFKDHLAKIRASTDPDDIEQKQVDLWIKFILMREKGNQQNSEKENLTSDINLNLDTILEKINDSGMDSLTKDEKTFLTNQK